MTISHTENKYIRSIIWPVYTSRTVNNLPIEARGVDHHLNEAFSAERRRRLAPVRRVGEDKELHRCSAHGISGTAYWWQEGRTRRNVIHYQFVKITKKASEARAKVGRVVYKHFCNTVYLN